MASYSSMFSLCRRCQSVLRYTSRVWTKKVYQVAPKTCLLTASVFLAQCQTKEKLDLKAPDADNLSQEYLLRAASANTADAVTTLLSQTAHSLIQAEEKYRHMVGVLIQLLELHVEALGNKEEEDRVWDIILQARARVQTYRRQIQDLQMLLSCVQKLTDAAAEVAFLAGSEFSSTSLGERQYNAQRHIDSAREQSKEIDSQLQEVEARCIEAISQHAEREEKRKKAEEEMFGDEMPEEPSVPVKEEEKKEDES